MVRKRQPKYNEINVDGDDLFTNKEREPQTTFKVVTDSMDLLRKNVSLIKEHWDVGHIRPPIQDPETGKYITYLNRVKPKSSEDLNDEGESWDETKE